MSSTFAEHGFYTLLKKINPGTKSYAMYDLAASHKNAKHLLFFFAHTQTSTNMALQ